MNPPDSPSITGKITAEPQSLPADRTPLILRWECSAIAAKLWVAEAGAPEKLISHGKHGSVTIDWIQAGRSYVFRLYTADESRRLLDEVTVCREIKGALEVRPDPNPLSGNLTLQWTITEPAIGEICLAEDGAEERVVCRGSSGSFEVAGLRLGSLYTFRLYAARLDRQLLAEVSMRLPDIPWSLLLQQLQRSAGSKAYDKGFADFMAAVLPVCIRSPQFPEWFRQWEASGVHLTPVHFYQPIPDSRILPDALWDQPTDLPGVDLNEKSQVHLLREALLPFRDEFEQIPAAPGESPSQFHLQNGRFDALDPLLAYCLVRHFRPQRIIEVGSGYSTLLLAQAALKNGTTILESVEPYPEDFLTQGVPGLSALRQEKVEDVPLSYFTNLSAGDILFIDTSHVVRIGGDVNYLYLRILPRLKPGVIVHIHDIFFPFEYPRDWVIEERRFWTEQYLLQAFLAHNSAFEVLVSSAYLHAQHLAEIAELFPTASPWRGGSFWMRRRIGAHCGGRPS